MSFFVEYINKSGLEKFFRTIKAGQYLEGKIIDIVPPDGYLLRIRGYNILTQSNGLFKKNDKISLVVKEVNSHLVLDLISNQNKSKKYTSNHTDIIA